MLPDHAALAWLRAKNAPGYGRTKPELPVAIRCHSPQPGARAAWLGCT